MCGRYIIPAEFERLYYDFDALPPLLRAEWDRVEPNYDMCPTQPGPILRKEESGLVMDIARWGLVPAWAKDSKLKYPTHNARSETVAEKPSFRSAFRARRCLVPAGGYYEWRGEPGNKTRYFIRPRTEKLFLFAGLWEVWQPAEGEGILSYTIVTTVPNGVMEPIHDRMPVILDQEQAGKWLDPGVEAKELVATLQGMLNPCPNEWIEAWETVKHPSSYHGEGLMERALIL